jgi:[protein-PII] uridylyltransferase
LVDEAIRALTRDLGPRVAVVALGGYGRRVLCPGSDVDLMVLHAERRDDKVRQAAEQVFYPFWNAGIPLGHAVRTVGESLAEASDRLDVVCSLLDARPVAGDPALHEEMDRKLRATLSKQRDRWLERLAEDAAARHSGTAACSTSLEPDLKEGSGGLRDVHAVGWTLAIARDRADLIRQEERARLDRAEEFLVRLRSALHLLTAKRGDRLFRDHQIDLAPALGFDAAGGLDPADALMRGLFEHARHVEHARTLVMERARASSEPSVDDPAPLDPEGILETLAQHAGARTSPPATWLDRLESADLGERPFGWTDRMRTSFVEILAAGDAGTRALEILDRAELLAAYLPEWEAVRCRPQRDPYHRYTVDVHLAATAAIAADLISGVARDRDDQAFPAAPLSDRDRESLLLGAFLHDIGKTGEGRHVEIGQRAASAALDRMGFSEETRDAAVFLVREHLLLSDTATRRDLTDTNLVLDVAARVGDVNRLAMLYLLTIADAEATGPHAVTPWRMGLVRELVGRVEHALERRDMDTELARELDGRLARVRELLQGEPALDRFLERIPRLYVLSVPPEDVAAHFSLLSPALGSRDVRTAARAGERAGTWEVTVVAADRPGLLARMAGSLALSGLSILSAQAFTTEDGVAIDLFVVEPAFHGDIDEERWRTLRHTLRKALEGRLSLEYRVREKRRHYPQPQVDVPSEVRVMNDVSEVATVVEVEAPDRLGLLFDLARTFEELHLDVALAKVATYGPRVIDAFYVCDLYGQKIEDAEHAEEIRRAILSRLRD